MYMITYTITGLLRLYVNVHTTYTIMYTLTYTYTYTIMYTITYKIMYTITDTSYV